MKLQGHHIYLRAVEKDDATKLLLWENDPQHWKVSGTEVPYSLSAILEYIEQAQHIRAHGQLRLMICKKETDEAVGTIDLYNTDFKHRRTSIGILIAEKDNRNSGFATESLELVENYAVQILGLVNFHASIHADNSVSLYLFEKAGFERVGKRKNWFLDGKIWIDEIILQKWLEKKDLN